METVHFVVAQSDGQIIRRGTCPRSMVAIQAGIGEQAIEGVGDPLTQYVWDGSIRDFTEDQVRRRSSRPGSWFVWRMADMDWHDPRPRGDALSAAKEERWATVKAERGALIDAQIDTDFGRFDGDGRSRTAIVEALVSWCVGGTKHTGTLAWTTADNRVVDLTVAQLGELARLLAERTQTCREQASRLRASIEAAGTPEELAAITWPQAP